jgi:hypothetical protein
MAGVFFGMAEGRASSEANAAIKDGMLVNGGSHRSKSRIRNISRNQLVCPYHKWHEIRNHHHSCLGIHR